LIADCLKGIDYLLRRDNSEERHCFVKMGEWNTLSTHLIPLLISYREDREILFLVGMHRWHCTVIDDVFAHTPLLCPLHVLAAKLMARLTMPIPVSATHRVSELRYQQNYKESFLKPDVVASLMTWVEDALAADPK